MKLIPRLRGYTSDEDALILSNLPLKVIARRLERSYDSVKGRRRFLRGRKPWIPEWTKTRKERHTSIGGWIPNNLYEQADNLRLKRKISLSALVRTALQEYVNAHKE
jgi:hypothetical protein